MLISSNWLSELTGTRLNPQELRDRLTNAGLTVDAVEQHGDDFVLDVEVASNRGDCLSHIGIARELAVIEKSKVQSPKSEVKTANGRTADGASVEIVDADLCPRYVARIVRGVEIAPSPAWLTKRLEAIGQRPINNVADITNYVLHEFGQPLHAFDLAKLGDRKIVVRRAAKGEMIKTLDGTERKLDEEMLVIADATRPVAVAGVMGGEDTEISQATADVLIESAFFTPSSVRRTAKLLGLHTEASHRFERGTDPEGVLAAQERCVALICELAGGTATADALDVYPLPVRTRTVTLRPKLVTDITSLTVEMADIKRILSALGFAIEHEEAANLSVSVPSWRHDVTIEEDLVEEIARHIGYDEIKTELPPASLAGEYHSSEERKRRLRLALAARGFHEAINLSFIETTGAFQHIPAIGDEARFVTLMNPIIEEASRMRPSLLPGLLNSIRHNINQGVRDVSLFEVGRVFAASANGELPNEREALALVATGGLIEADRAQAIREVDFFDIKGALESAVEAMNLPALAFAATEVKHLQPGQSAAVLGNGARVGWLGRLAEGVASEYKFRQPIFVGEIDLTSVLQLSERPVLYSPLPRFPSVVRDSSLLVDRAVTVAELQRAATERGVANLIAVTFVGTYEGEGIAEDKRSVTLRFEYRADDHTMRDEEVDALHWPLVEVLKKQFQAEVR
jgi:phenylalanyl-tRNA synthetase beta chain